MVYSRLATPQFRKRLTAKAPDGTHPILVVLPHEPIGALLDQMNTVSGAANVVVPLKGGLAIIAMEVRRVDTPTDNRR